MNKHTRAQLAHDAFFEDGERPDFSKRPQWARVKWQRVADAVEVAVREDCALIALEKDEGGRPRYADGHEIAAAIRGKDAED